MKQIYRALILWGIMGAIYLVIEGLWRIPQGGFINIAMLPVGGLCGVLVGAINQKTQFYRMPIALQALIGTIIVLGVEFIAGCILNLWLGLDIWNYTSMPGNIMGQICLPFAGAWFLLMPFAIWLEDRLRLGLWEEGIPYTLRSIYWDLITFK